jgi:hypothetical protein
MISARGLQGDMHHAFEWASRPSDAVLEYVTGITQERRGTVDNRTHEQDIQSARHSADADTRSSATCSGSSTHGPVLPPAPRRYRGLRGSANVP